MKSGIIFGALAIILAIFAYYINFNEGAGFSSDKNEWAAFGDFVGGFTTPIITFITMCMLITSLNLQKKANESLIEQNKQSKDIGVHQKEIEGLRSFESTFYNLAAVARKEYDALHLTLVDGGDIYIGSDAVGKLEDMLSEKACMGEEFSSLNEAFDSFDERSAMGIFSAVRSFYILFKVTIESCPKVHQERYVDICVYSMPVRFINLVCLAKVFTSWGNLNYLSDHDFFSRPGIKQYIEQWTELSRHTT